MIKKVVSKSTVDDSLNDAAVDGDDDIDTDDGGNGDNDFGDEY